MGVLPCLAYLASASGAIIAEGSGGIDSLSGSGWVGAGLLGAVLAWVFFKHLPDKDAQLKGFIESRDKLSTEKDKRVEKILSDQTSFLTTVDKERRDDFKTSLQIIVDHCARESTMQRDIMVKDLAESSQAIVDLRQVLEGVRETMIHLCDSVKINNGYAQHMRDPVK